MAPASRQNTVVAMNARPVTRRFNAGPAAVVRKTSLWKNIGASTNKFFTHWCGRMVLIRPRTTLLLTRVDSADTTADCGTADVFIPRRGRRRKSETHEPRAAFYLLPSPA